MSVNNLERQKTRLITDNHIYRIITVVGLDPYPDDGVFYYENPSNNWEKGKNIKKRKIMHYQYRMYRTWKHNRKHQYK